MNKVRAIVICVCVDVLVDEHVSASVYRDALAFFAVFRSREDYELLID